MGGKQRINKEHHSLRGSQIKIVKEFPVAEVAINMTNDIPKADLYEQLFNAMVNVHEDPRRASLWRMAPWCAIQMAHAEQTIRVTESMGQRFKTAWICGFCFPGGS